MDLFCCKHNTGTL